MLGDKASEKTTIKNDRTKMLPDIASAKTIVQKIRIKS